MNSIPPLRSIPKVRRYLGDAQTFVLHDTRREQERCRLVRVPFEYRRWYHSEREAARNPRYERCFWCFGMDEAP